MADGRYAHGKVYRLVNSADNEEYVGSTCTSLAKRLYHHKKDAKTQTTRQVYQHLNEVGWGNVDIVLVEEYPCENKMELLRRERHWVDELNPTLNKQVPTRTIQEYKKQNAVKIKEQSREYYQQNIDKIKKNRQRNADKIKEQRHKHYQENAEKLKGLSRERRKQNGDAIRARDRQRYQDNREVKLERNHARYKEHREAILAKVAEKRDENRDTYNAYMRGYRQRKKAEREAQQPS